jgi:hypothetical protein
MDCPGSAGQIEIKIMLQKSVERVVGCAKFSGVGRDPIAHVSISGCFQAAICFEIALPGAFDLGGKGSLLTGRYGLRILGPRGLCSQPRCLDRLLFFLLVGGSCHHNADRLELPVPHCLPSEVSE